MLIIEVTIKNRMRKTTNGHHSMNLNHLNPTARHYGLKIYDHAIGLIFCSAVGQGLAEAAHSRALVTSIAIGMYLCSITVEHRQRKREWRAALDTAQISSER